MATATITGELLGDQPKLFTPWIAPAAALTFTDNLC
jgi:hypothetical protein